MLLVLDNYDSFVHNLARYLRQQGEVTEIVRSDQIDIDQIATMQPSGIVLSPGPQTPDEAGVCLEVVRRFASSIPMLGVCLGHQVIAQAFGGKIIRAEPMHGMASSVHHHHDGIFSGMPTPFLAGRYHSLIADTHDLPRELQVTAWTSRSAGKTSHESVDFSAEASSTSDLLIMGLRHRQWPVFGVQFHPESILTEHGDLLLSNFLKSIAGTLQS
ncbi:MAG: aminodeoxychorismate/anthranilate synthase component II [Pirellulaceae bacterium]